MARFRNWLSRVRYRGATHDQIFDADYFRFVDRTTTPSAGTIANSILDSFHPTSVIDVGCGTGVLIDRLRASGVAVRGFEVASAALEFCRTRELDVVKFDVETDPPPDVPGADLVISLEVGAQLQEASSGRYVDLLCRLAPAVVFSVEAPGGGDRRSRNEQPHSYWVGKFADRGYRLDESLTHRWRADWKERGTAPWFSRNVMVFRRNDTVPGPTNLVPTTAVAAP